MHNKDKKSDDLITLIEDPYGLNTAEISEIQNSTEELILDQDMEDSEQPSESLDDQFNKLAQAISSLEEPPVESESNPEAELAAQIQEDQALAQEILQEERQEEQEESLEANVTPIEPLTLTEIQSCAEALLFISDKPVSVEKLREHLEPSTALAFFQEAMSLLRERYQSPHHGIELVEVAGGYQFRTKPERASLAKKLVKIQTQRLSSGAMETLAIIAYKQPVMKEEIDKIRGVDSSYFVRGLLDKKLIEISGRSELPGRPILYSTTREFLEIFGLKDLSSLPSLRELEQMIPGSQTQNPEDEDPRVREMRRLVGEMKADRTSALHYNPKEDDKILKEIKEKITAIPTSTPYLEDMKAAEILAQKAAENPEQPEEPTNSST